MVYLTLKKFAKKVFSVTGVDLSPFLLDKARQRAKTEKLDIEWILEDMRKHVRPGYYDLVLNMFTSFGYFDDKSDDLIVLNNIFTSLRPGGAFLIDVMERKGWLKYFSLRFQMY